MPRPSRFDYDLVVIGGGAAGLTGSGLGASLGAKTLLVERDRLGGDCTWTGCIPSKTLLHAAHVAATARAGTAGVAGHAPEIDTAAVMGHIRAVRQHVYDEADAPERIEAHGVETTAADAVFEDPHTLRLTSEGGDVRQVTFRKALIATGSEASVPKIPGLDATPYLTHATFFEQETLPERTLVVGAGPIGAELGQALVGLGGSATLLDHSDRFLPHDDPDLADALRKRLESDGLVIRLGVEIARVDREGSGVRVTLKSGETLDADALLIAAGRRPRTDGLGLSAAGVTVTKTGGIEVDRRGRTSASHIFAAGDVTGGPAFTHWAEHTARIAVQNALLLFPVGTSRGQLPWVTYTAPELGHVGETAETLRERGTAFETYRFPYARLDRAITEDATAGEIVVHARSFDGKLYGASVLGARAGEIVGVFSLAIANGIPLRSISSAIFAYPTYALGARRAADQWIVSKQSAWLVRLIQTVFGYRGPVVIPEPGTVV